MQKLESELDFAKKTRSGQSPVGGSNCGACCHMFEFKRSLCYYPSPSSALLLPSRKQLSLVRTPLRPREKTMSFFFLFSFFLAY